MMRDGDAPSEEEMMDPETRTKRRIRALVTAKFDLLDLEERREKNDEYDQVDRFKIDRAVQRVLSYATELNRAGEVEIFNGRTSPEPAAAIQDKISQGYTVVAQQNDWIYFLKPELKTIWDSLIKERQS
jgi:hypothetical protein